MHIGLRFWRLYERGLHFSTLCSTVLQGQEVDTTPVSLPSSSLAHTGYWRLAKRGG